jgi:hypothetical protein
MQHLTSEQGWRVLPMKRSKNIMLKLLRLPIVLVVLLTAPLTVAAQDESRRDQQAMVVLQSMSEFLGGLEAFEIKGVALEDADFGEGLIVTNPTEVHAMVKRPGSISNQNSRIRGHSRVQ